MKHFRLIREALHHAINSKSLSPEYFARVPQGDRKRQIVDDITIAVIDLSN
jgi:hypothetical protein